jgi:hypothetical protein
MIYISGKVCVTESGVILSHVGVKLELYYGGHPIPGCDAETNLIIWSNDQVSIYTYASSLIMLFWMDISIEDKLIYNLFNRSI